MIELRGVRPRYACEPGSRLPWYASTSVRRTATTPSAVSCSITQPRRSGATAAAGRLKNERFKMRPVTAAPSQPAVLLPSASTQHSGLRRFGRHRPRQLTGYSRAQVGHLLDDPLGCGAATRRAGGKRTPYREHRSDSGREMWRELRKLRIVDIGQVATVSCAPRHQ